MLREFFTADIQRIESVSTIGTMLQQVLFGLRLLLHRLVLMEAVPTPLHPSRLDSEYQIIVILPVKKRHQALLTRKALIDEQLLLIMAHRVTQVHILHLPPMALKLMDDHIPEVLVVHGIVRAESRSVVVVDNRLVLMISVVRAEIIDQGGNLTLELDVERLEDVQAVARGLASHNPVDIRIVVHTDANGSQRVHVFIGAGIKLRVER